MVPAFTKIAISQFDSLLPPNQTILTNWISYAIEKEADAIMIRQKYSTDVMKMIIDESNLICIKFKCKLILNVENLYSIPTFPSVPVYHFKSSFLKENQLFNALHIPAESIIGISCHTKQEVLLAQSFGFNYAFLSPIFATTSHPESKPLGLDYLVDVCSSSKIPIYALGGVDFQNCSECLAAGANGIAGIQMFKK